jgi:ABC-type branched-subunit amino acid transport system substrate-binding protein
MAIAPEVCCSSAAPSCPQATLQDVLSGRGLAGDLLSRAAVDVPECGPVIQHERKGDITMNIQAQSLRRVGTAFLVAILVSLPNGADAKPKKTTHKFGVMLPLTGPVAGAGIEERAIIDFALRGINARGGNQFVAIYADDRCDIPAEPTDPDFNRGRFATAAKAYDQLTEDAKVDFILGTVCSGSADAVVDDLVEDRVVMVSAQNSDAALLEGRSPNYFSLSFSDNDIARRIAQEICALASGGRAALITEDVPFTQSLRANDKGTGVLDFLKSECANPPTIVSDQIFSSATTDFSGLVANLQAAAADIIFINPNAGVTADGVLDEMERQGPWNQLIGDGVLNVQGTLQKDAERVALVEGMVIIDAPQITADLPIGPLPETPTYYVASTLDAVEILTSLIERFNGVQHMVRRALATETFDGFISEVTSSGDIFFGGQSFVRGVVATKFVVRGGVAGPQ